MLNPYRRHGRSCAHRGEGRKYRRCRCPIWVEGLLGDQPIRKSLGTRDWDRALETVHRWEAERREPVAIAADPITLEQAWERFLADAEARKLADPTIYKYRLLSRQMQAFSARFGLRFVEEWEDLDRVGRFRAEWREGPRTSLKKLERLRTFLGFAQKRQWIRSNPAAELKAPRVPVRPTLPFTREEMLRILAAIGDYGARAGRPNAQRLRAFVLLLRFSGMRIGDVVGCGVDRLADDRLFLYTQKTGVPVHLKLPHFVVEALEASPRTSSRYFFWTGQSKLHSAIGKWQRRLQILFRMANISGGHAHRFRDTCAVELLVAGVPLDRVSVILGHGSVRITEKHYAPWVRSRQEQLDADLERAWREDPVALLETNRTKNGHKDERIQ